MSTQINKALSIGVGLLMSTTSLMASQTLEYQWLTIGKPSGQQTLMIESASQRHFEFEFSDRGRGPKTTTTVKLNELGIPIAFTSKGVNYLKGEVDEVFQVSNGQASWRSSIEQSHATFEGKAFYLAESWAPEYSAILARALLLDADGVLPLLPSGEATIQKVLTEQLTIDGETQSISLYAINGLQEMPDFIWLDESLELFGFDAGWFGMTPTGAVEHIDLLKRHQEQQTDQFIRDFSDGITEHIDGLTVITHANLFDPVTGKTTPNSTVFMLNGQVTVVYTDKVDVPIHARKIDAKGDFVMPALWDMHAHIQPGSYFNYIAQGITNIRDMANEPEYIVRARQQINTGEIAAPNIHPVGFIDQKSEFAAPTGLLAESLEQAMEYVDYYAQRGFYGIKLYSSIEPEWVKPIAEYAHGLGLSVLGHIPSGMSAEDAVHAGFDEITHINMFLLNFLDARDIDTRTPKRFTEVGERAHTINLQSTEVKAFVELLAKNQVAHDPTLGIFLNIFFNQPGKVTPVFEPIAEHLPALTRRGLVSGKSFNDGHEVDFAKAGEVSKQAIKYLHEKGIRLLPGTDSGLPGMALIEELALYVDAGINNADVLRAATWESALHMGLEHQYGRIVPKQRAHILIIKGNPLKNINDLHRVHTVIKDNQLYKPQLILEKQGFKAFQ